jgi:hypothetical protein
MNEQYRKMQYRRQCQANVEQARDKFAAVALNAIVAMMPRPLNQNDLDKVAATCWRFADAIMARRRPQLPETADISGRDVKLDDELVDLGGEGGTA